MTAIVKYVAWIVSILALLMIFFGFLGYFLGNIRIFGNLYGTYFLFGHYLLFSSVVLLLLSNSIKENK